MRLETHNQPEPGMPVPNPNDRPAEDPSGEFRRRLTLSTEEMERLADLVDQMRERH